MPDPLPQLEALEARRQAATPGPWFAADWTHEPNGTLKVFSMPCEAAIAPSGFVVEEDAEFCALARNTDLQPAIAEIRRLREEIRWAADELRKWARASGLAWPSRIASELDEALTTPASGEGE